MEEVPLLRRFPLFAPSDRFILFLWCSGRIQKLCDLTGTSGNFHTGYAARGERQAQGDFARTARSAVENEPWQLSPGVRACSSGSRQARTQ